MELNGYAGRFLRINLTDKKFYLESKDGSYYKKYIGGVGFMGQVLLEELPSRIDPLSPDNKLIFAVGPFDGLPLAGGGRHTVGAISPLTDGSCKSEVGE